MSQDVQLIDAAQASTIVGRPGVVYVLRDAPNTVYVTNGSRLVPVRTLLDTLLMTAGDVINATTAFADIAGLTCDLKAGRRYAFEAALFHVNDATTTGSQFAVNIGAAPTALIVGEIGVVTPSVTAAAMSSGVATARDTAFAAQTTGSQSVRITRAAGSITPSADGTFAMRCKSEVAVAAGLTVKAGSWLRVTELP